MILLYFGYGVCVFLCVDVYGIMFPSLTCNTATKHSTIAKSVELWRRMWGLPLPLPVITNLKHNPDGTSHTHAHTDPLNCIFYTILVKLL